MISDEAAKYLASNSPPSLGYQHKPCNVLEILQFCLDVDNMCEKTLLLSLPVLGIVINGITAHREAPLELI